MSESSTDLESKILSWLEKQGYPLEMKVASAFRAAGFDTRQGWHYDDPETGQSREIDVIASTNQPDGVAEIDFVVECKASSKPWVLFSHEHTLVDFSRVYAFGILSEDARRFMSKNALKTINNPKEQARFPGLYNDGRVGYSVTQAFGSGEDATHRAITQAVKASLWLLESSPWMSCDHRKYVFAFPIVVTNAPLYECYLDEEGRTELQRIRNGKLFFTRRFSRGGEVLVTICNQDGLYDLVLSSKTLSDNLYQDLQQNISDYLNHLS